MKKLVLAALVTLLTSASYAKGGSDVGSGEKSATMTCLLGVYKASNLIDEKENDKAVRTVTILTDSEDSQDFKINGENVSVNMYKRDFADVYNFTAVLTTPEADRIPNTSIVAVLSDNLINEGPAKQDGFTVGFKPGSTRFEYMRYSSGAIATTKKFNDAYKKLPQTDVYSLITPGMTDVQSSYAIAEATEKLVAMKLLKPTDVVALSSVFSCTLNK